MDAAGEKKRKRNREYQRKRREDPQFREREKDRQRRRRADPELRQLDNKRRRVGNQVSQWRIASREARIARDIQAEEANIPVRVLELNEFYDSNISKYQNWPEVIPVEIGKDGLVEYREKVDLAALRESPCVVCSELSSSSGWQGVSVEKVDLSLLKAPIELTDPLFGIGFHYGHRI